MSEVQVLSQEQVLAQLKTRGFEEGFQRTPLKDFWGVMESYTGEMRTGNNGSYLVVLYNFTNVEVIESSEPYASPIAQLEIPHSARAKSKMGYWGESIDKIINAGVPLNVPQERVKNQDFLIGKMGHYKLTSGNMIWNITEKVEKPVDCWKLIELRGAAPAGIPAMSTPATLSGTIPTPAQVPIPAGQLTATQVALQLLNGKTEQEWFQEVFPNPTVKTDPALVNNIISRKFLPPLELAGIVAKDVATGIYTVKVPV